MAIHPEARVGCTQIWAANLQNQLTFYQQILGFSILERHNGTVTLGAQSGESILTLVDAGGTQPIRRTTGLYHFAVLVPSREELARSLWRIIDADWPLQGVADHGVSEAIYLADPEGNGIEIYRDRPRSEWPITNGQLRMVSDPLDVDTLLELADREEARSRNVAQGTSLGHIHLKVTDIPSSVTFYTQVLGFDLVQYYGDSAAFVSAGGYHHHIGMNTWESQGAPPAPTTAAGLDLFTVIVPDPQALQEIIERVKNSGIDCEAVQDGWIVEDPSKNKILLKTLQS